METRSRMYDNAKTWNVFKGCGFFCAYCEPSFQKQSKRQKKCMRCYRYIPHWHEERLSRIPSADVIFVCGSADISFCAPKHTRKIINRIKEHNMKCPYKTYYFQSKRPEYFKKFLTEFPDNVILVTTLETNRDSGYHKISKAPAPTVRYHQFRNLEYPRKVVTIEPVMNFDLDVFPGWIIDLDPEYVWLGYNSRPAQVQLPEPPIGKVFVLVKILRSASIGVRAKELRGLYIGSLIDGSYEQALKIAHEGAEKKIEYELCSQPKVILQTYTKTLTEGETSWIQY